MEGNTKEHLNMDSAPGGMPPEKTPDKLKQKAPKGEYNPWQRHLIPHSEREDYVRENQLQRSGDPAMAQFAADYDAIQSLLPDNKQKQFIKDSHAVEEQTETTNRMLKERDLNLMKTWIQQNPAAAAKIGITEEDPYGQKKPKKGSPTKYTESSPLEYSMKAYEWFNEGSPLKAYNFMSPGEAMRFGRQMYTNPMNTIGVKAAEIIGQQIDQFEQRRAQQLEEDKKQFEREAKDFDDNFGSYIQNMENTQALDESSKELMAQQWKQEFAQLNKLKNQNPPGISASDYSMKKNQLLANAGQYNTAVNNITQKSQEWLAALDANQVSAGTPRSQRDLLNTIARGKGINFVNTEDGKSVMNKGLSVQNVNGQPSMVGFTEGMEAKMREEYNKLTTVPNEMTGQPDLDPSTTSFEAWAGSKINDPKNKPGGSNYEQLPEHWKGVNIPIGNLASGEGIPNFIMKDDAFGQQMTQFSDDLANQAIGDVNNPIAMSIEDKWDTIQGRADEYANQMLNAASEGQLRSIYSDYLGEPHEVFDSILQGGATMNDLRADIKPKLLDALKKKFYDNPTLRKQNDKLYDYQYRLSLANVNNAARTGKVGGKREMDEELQRQRAQALQQGNYQQFVGQASTGNKIDEIQEVDPRSMYEKWMPNAIGGKSAPEERHYRVTVNGEKLPAMPESQLKALIQDKYGIKGSHMGGGAQQSAPQQPLDPQVSAQVDDIMAELGYGSPTQYREESPLMASRGARKAAQNRATKAAHAESRAERSAEWDRQREEENVTLGDIALEAAGALPYAGMLAGGSKAAKAIKGAAKAYTSKATGAIKGGAGEAIAGNVGDAASGAGLSVGKGYVKGKAKDLVKKGLKAGFKGLGVAGDVAGAAAKGIGVAGTAKALYDTGKKMNQYQRQNMTDEEYENFKRTGSTTGSRRGRNSRGRKS